MSKYNAMFYEKIKKFIPFLAKKYSTKDSPCCSYHDLISLGNLCFFEALQQTNTDKYEEFRKTFWRIYHRKLRSLRRRDGIEKRNNNQNSSLITSSEDLDHNIENKKNMFLNLEISLYKQYIMSCLNNTERQVFKYCVDHYEQNNKKYKKIDIRNRYSLTYRECQRILDRIEEVTYEVCRCA